MRRAEVSGEITNAETALVHRVHITPEAVVLFRRGIELQRGPHDPYELSNLKNALAAALGRSKFAASPLDRQPRLRLRP